MHGVKTTMYLAKWLTLYISACCCFKINLVGISRQAQSWLLLLHDESEWKICNQILLEVLMNRTKHFDLSSSSTASCVARLMICWVCRLHFSRLVCSVLSLDECLIKINYGRFCVAPRKPCRLVWCRDWLILSNDKNRNISNLKTL